MKISFFLIPKDEVIYVKTRSTMRQALERMEYHRYSAVPIIDADGRYVGTLTEGDLLWKIRNTPGLHFENIHQIPLSEVPQRMQNTPVHIDSDIADLLSLAEGQSFVPVVDDRNVFIGIVRRREIIQYCSKLIRNLEANRTP